MDYGNFDELPVSSLVAMTDEFIELPVQAVHCRLAGTKQTIFIDNTFGSVRLFVRLLDCLLVGALVFEPFDL